MDIDENIHYFDQVSILVLMDVVREADGEAHERNIVTRFNPCSNGCRSGSPMLQR